MVTRRRQHGSGQGSGGQADGDDKGFLSRWSERKRAAEAGTLPEEAEAGSEAAKADAAPAQQVPGADAESTVPAELPDIDTLEAGADFSVFMKQGVPAVLQRRALRKLWQVDPVFNEICMLDDYNLDYTDAAMVVPNLKTSYQVGRGMVLPEELEAELKAAAEQAERSDAEAVGTEEAAALPAPEGPEEEGADVAAAESSEAQPASSPSVPRRAPRKPGTPLVKPAPTPTPGSAHPASSGTVRSARGRRWGDTDS
ncbi:DUF3306 domain-containing protein [Pelagibius sp. 7325]|uniref:DUF3306 domain-containing protein n=1 Tax=Pelagibius sp. 7325 TaxID=3131994 RepID=UPI0030EE42E8